MLEKYVLFQLSFALQIGKIPLSENFKLYLETENLLRVKGDDMVETRHFLK